MKVKLLTNLNCVSVITGISFLPISLISCSNPVTQVTVTLDPDGGQISQTSFKINKSTQYTDSLFPTPTKQNYKFEGWELPNKKIIYDGYVFESDITLKATYKIDIQTAKVTLDPNGGYIGKTSYEVPKGSDFYEISEDWKPLPPQEYSRFLYWTFLDGSLIPLDYKINDDITVKAFYI